MTKRTAAGVRVRILLFSASLATGPCHSVTQSPSQSSHPSADEFQQFDRILKCESTRPVEKQWMHRHDGDCAPENVDFWDFWRSAVRPVTSDKSTNVAPTGRLPINDAQWCSFGPPGTTSIGTSGRATLFASETPVKIVHGSSER